MMYLSQLFTLFDVTGTITAEIRSLWGLKTPLTTYILASLRDLVAEYLCTEAWSSPYTMVHAGTEPSTKVQKVWRTVKSQLKLGTPTQRRDTSPSG